MGVAKYTNQLLKDLKGYTDSNKIIVQDNSTPFTARDREKRKIRHTAGEKTNWCASMEKGMKRIKEKKWGLRSQHNDYAKDIRA